MDVDPTTPLLYVLSDDLALRGPKFGCGLGQCGSCIAIVNGRAERTCVTPVSLAADATITTLEGLGTPEELHPLQRAFIDEQAAQCGFCLSGVMLTAKALIDENRDTRVTLVRIRSSIACAISRTPAYGRSCTRPPGPLTGRRGRRRGPIIHALAWSLDVVSPAFCMKVTMVM